MLIVQKFGGSSLADAERIDRAARRVIRERELGNDVVVVVSACGDATDELRERAGKAEGSEGLRELDALLSTGENQSAALMALFLQRRGVKARSFSCIQAGIYAEGSFGMGRISFIAPAKLKKALSEGIIPVAAGFQAADARGNIMTLGRGGSDTSAAALCAALSARRCDIYTDVDGIYTADPRLVPDALPLERIDYRDMLALSLAGSQVLHPESVKIAMANKLDLRLRPAFSGGEGSRLCFLSRSERPDIAGVTRDREKSAVTAAGPGAGPELYPVFQKALEEAGIKALSFSAGEGCASVKVAPEALNSALGLIHGALIK